MVLSQVDAALRLVIDGVELALEMVEGRYVFALPAGAQEIRLVSRKSVPAEPPPEPEIIE
jgi:hypothetical protein